VESIKWNPPTKVRSANIMKHEQHSRTTKTASANKNKKSKNIIKWDPPTKVEAALWLGSSPPRDGF